MRALRLLTLSLILALVLSGMLAASPSQADPYQATVERTAASSVATGLIHTCVVTAESNVRCWGSGTYGQLGYGNDEDTGDNPPSVVGDVPLGAPAVAVAAGNFHSCALLSTGSVRCWGRNDDGQLGYGHETTIGDGATPGFETPAVVGDVPLGGTAVAITARYNQTCALMTTGGVRCWGDGGYTRLGYGASGDLGDDETPAEVGDVPLGVPAKAVSAGENFTCVLLSGGEVRCWGQGVYGQMGTGSQAGNTDPATAPNVVLGASAVALSAGAYHACAILTTGAVRCWGNGADGRLGYGDDDWVGDGLTSGKETPAAAGNVPLGDTATATAIGAGAAHTCAVLATGSVRCWGFGLYGRHGYGHTDNVGDGTTAGFETPSAAGDLNLGGTALALTGFNHTCAVLSDASLRCWGGTGSKLGHGSSVLAIGDDETPADYPVVPVGALIRTIGEVEETPSKADTKLKIKGKPGRDKKAPFKFQLKGKVKGSFARNGDTCSGKVKVVLKRGKKKVAKVKAPLTKKCTFKKNVKVKPGNLGAGKGKVKLKVQATFKGNDLLLGSKAKTKVYAR